MLGTRWSGYGLCEYVGDGWSEVVLKRKAAATSEGRVALLCARRSDCRFYKSMSLGLGVLSDIFVAAITKIGRKAFISTCGGGDRLCKCVLYRGGVEVDIAVTALAGKGCVSLLRTARGSQSFAE